MKGEIMYNNFAPKILDCSLSCREKNSFWRKGDGLRRLRKSSINRKEGTWYVK